MDVKQNLRNVDSWLRGLFIVIFAIIFYFLIGIILLLVIFQFLTTVITGKLNNQLEKFSGVLTDYALQILQFVTYQSDLKPFPFSPFPDEEDNAQPSPDEAETVVKEMPVDPDADTETPAEQTKQDNQD